MDQNPFDLVLGVAAGELSCALTVLAKKTIYVGEWAFNFHVLGESHLVTIQRNDRFVWQELLSCRELPFNGLLHHRRFSRMANHCWQYDNYVIRVCFADEPAYEPALEDYLEVEFPVIEGVVPYTRVQWKLQSEGVRWETVHTYPHPAGVTHVITESVFNVK